LELRKAWRC